MASIMALYDLLVSYRNKSFVAKTIVSTICKTSPPLHCQSATNRVLLKALANDTKRSCQCEMSNA